ncbi:MAG: helix-hairpin-helix domain-containing protein [Candidatus Edwardsbacteria bacterium]
MIKSIFSGFLFFVFFCFSLVTPVRQVQAQSRQDGTQSSDESLPEIEKLLDSEEETTKNEDLLEQLDFLKSNPLDLNRADASDLIEIPWISPPLALAIVSYRRQIGHFHSLEELKIIAGIDDDFIQKIRPFLFVPEKPVKFFSGNLRLRFKRDKPNVNTIYHRSQITIKERLKAGFLIEKKETTRTKFFLSVDSPIPIIHRAVGGNYKLSFGQGLLFSGLNPVFQGRGVKFNTPTEIRPSLASTSLCGGAIDLRIRDFDLFFYGSFHHEKLFGSRLVWKLSPEKFQFGLTGYHSSFSSSENSLVSTDFDFFSKNLNLFGELAQNKGGGKGVVLGSILDFGKFFLETSLRRVNKKFFSPYSFFENSAEEKLTFALKYKLFSGTELAGFFSQSNHYEKISGREEERSLEWEQRLRSDLSFTLRQERRQKDFASEQRDKTRFELCYQVFPQLNWRTRLEQIFSKTKGIPGQEKGNLIFSELDGKIFKNLSGQLRMIFFDTDSYNCRVYEYEGKPAGVSSNVVLYGKGRRWMVALGEKFSSSISVSTKYARTDYYLKTKSPQQDFAWQLDWRW